jgi:hypothetical protein
MPKISSHHVQLHELYNRVVMLQGRKRPSQDLNAPDDVSASYAKLSLKPLNRCTMSVL